jgi:hypothetical protein
MILHKEGVRVNPPTQQSALSGAASRNPLCENGFFNGRQDPKGMTDNRPLRPFTLFARSALHNTAPAGDE